ncbi:hypothetical protein BBJ28_00010058 [Nothophytophthora sp. Chile5]|nr:hypothetical protein BBJ28_00010058 [Nothophytophthora sp. Chile5]
MALTDSATSSSSQLSQASGSYRSHKRRLQTALVEPEVVAWLRGLTLELKTVRMEHRGVDFELRVLYKQPKDSEATPPVSWTVTRPFSEYRALQKRLLGQLQPDHRCSAECKWLYTVVKQHFPKSRLFGSNCPIKAERRKLELIRVLSTIQASLLNHGNHGCKVLMTEVSNIFADFLMGESTSCPGTLHTSASPCATMSLGKSCRDSAASIESYTTSDDEEEHYLIAALGFESWNVNDSGPGIPI